MKFIATVLASAAVVAAVPAWPAKRTAGITDVQILNYALTLEHLENAFYSGALAKFSAFDFEFAGLPSSAYGRFTQIAAHEAQHVALLSGALGSAATAPCTYSFPYNDPVSFAGLSGVLEGVGVSAYLGAAASISNPAYLTVAASILTTESRHQAWVSAVAEGVQPWSAPEDTPLDFSQIYTLAAQFITSCPSTNPALPVTAFPSLTASPANAASNTTVTYTFKSTPGTTYYAAYYYGLGVVTVPLVNMKAKVPTTMMGTYYTIITTSSDATAIADSNTVAGPLISTVNFSSGSGYWGVGIGIGIGLNL